MHSPILLEIGELVAKRKDMKPYSVTRKRVPTKKNPSKTEDYRVTPVYTINLYEQHDFEDLRNAGNAVKLFTHKGHDVYHMEHNRKKFSELRDVDKKALTARDSRWFVVYENKRPFFKDYIRDIEINSLPVIKRL